jgi:hypothetical protein
MTMILMYYLFAIYFSTSEDVVSLMQMDSNVLVVEYTMIVKPVLEQEQ